MTTEEAIKDIAATIRMAIQQRTEPLEARIAALAMRVTELEDLLTKPESDR